MEKKMSNQWKDQIENKLARGLLAVLRATGLSVTKISEDTGISRGTLYNFVTPSSRTMNPETYQTLLSYFKHLRSSDEDFNRRVADILSRSPADVESPAIQTEETTPSESSPAETICGQIEPEDEAPAAPSASVAEKTDELDAVVSHPSHYTQAAVTIEPIDITSRLPHPIASAVEYIVRAGHKFGQAEAVDLSKARYWLNHWMSMPCRRYTISVYEIALLLVFMQKNDRLTPLFSRTIGGCLACLGEARSSADCVEIPLEAADKDASDMVKAIDLMLKGKPAASQEVNHA